MRTRRDIATIVTQKVKRMIASLVLAGSALFVAFNLWLGITGSAAGFIAAALFGWLGVVAFRHLWKGTKQ